MKSYIAILFLIVSISGHSVSQVNSKAVPQAAGMNQYVTALMQKMTLEEKIGQLNLPSIGFDVTGPVLSQGVEEKIRKGLVGGVFNTYTPIAVRKLQQLAVNETRLKIPLLFGYDVIHGHRTIFPIALGLSSSWDPGLIERTARAAAMEATADGLNWVFSPMVDIARDPRWGRVSEGAGEDPWLGSQIARAMIRGYQGTDLSKDNTVLACVKHFALYGAGEAGRDYNTVDMSRIRMYNEYLPPYKAAVDAGVGSVMSSFNEIEGVPASGNKWLLTDLLRRQWGFKGFVVSDYTSINEMIQHGVGDEKKVGELSLNAGLDMDMVGEIFMRYGVDLVKNARVSQTQVDAACRRILEAKYKLGLFQDPYRYVNEERPAREMMSADKIELSKEAAMKSMVLLKNQGHILPLQSGKKIAFIGPLVKNQRELIGSWSGAGDWKKAVSIWDALQQKFGADKFSYAKGCNLVEDSSLRKRLNDHDGQLTIDPMSSTQMIEQAVQAANQADVVVAVLGEAFGMSGEAASRSMIGLLENQLELLKAIKATGKPVVLVLMNGRPLTLEWENANCDAILETWFSGSQAGNAIVSVLFGEYNPSGKLTMTFPRNTGQIPIYYNAKNTGRPMDPNNKYSTKYLDVPNTPLFPFGFGLSYTTFAYGDIKLSSATLRPGQTLTASVTVTNNGKYDGTETVQLYLRDLVGSISRPLKELKGFQKVFLKTGESTTVSFKITVDDLKFFNADHYRLVIISCSSLKILLDKGFRRFEFQTI
jgi:beta-glucosidase